jgi:Tfp pilus assembly protein PilF
MTDRSQPAEVHPPSGAVFAAALQHHQAGRLAEAERLCRQILAAEPQHHESLDLLGIIAAGCGHGDAAVALIERAAALCDDMPGYHGNLGLILQQLGRTDEAAGRFEQVVRLQPGNADAHNALAILHLMQGRFETAVASFGHVLALRPGDAEACCNLGVALQQLGRTDAAIAQFERALALRPDYPEACYNLGLAVQQHGRAEDAVALLERALALRPGYAEAAETLALLLHNLGIGAQERGRPDAAILCYERALALQPNHAEMRLSLALAKLLIGEFQAGWPLYETRWQTGNLAPAWRNFGVPQWDGAPGTGGTLLIWVEQGFGDTLQFCRYAPLAAARGWRVLVEAPPNLVRLLQTLPGVTILPTGGAAGLAIERHCPMMSLPLAFGTTLDTIPAAMPYLAATPDGIKHWQRELSKTASDGLTVGIVWAGNPRKFSALHTATDARRSVALDQLAPLFAVRGARFVSLQKDRRPGDDPSRHGLFDPMDAVGDFAETAALVAALDLVIAVDTSVVHLAGALGKPVWLLNRFDTCWRWLRDRTDSPWYPTLRQFHQPAPGDWAPVIEEAAATLAAIAGPALTGRIERRR